MVRDYNSSSGSWIIPDFMTAFSLPVKLKTGFFEDFNNSRCLSQEVIVSCFNAYRDLHIYDMIYRFFHIKGKRVIMVNI